MANFDVDGELAASVRGALGGDARSMRRVAELLELKGEDIRALVWWRRAADAGDGDALMYVAMLGDGPGRVAHRAGRFARFQRGCCEGSCWL